MTAGEYRTLLANQRDIPTFDGDIIVVDRGVAETPTSRRRGRPATSEAEAGRRPVRSREAPPPDVRLHSLDELVDYFIAAGKKGIADQPLQGPRELGKFDWGQGDQFPSLTEPEPAYHGLKFFENFGDFAFTTKARAVALRDFGPTLSPMNAFLTLTGIESLHVRMDRHVQNAQKVAEFLADHPRVAWVSYAGLKSSPYHELAKKYLPKGPGAVFTFGVKGGYEAGIRLVESVQLFSHLANIGDTRSLILHPASTTHRQLCDEQREAAGAGPDVVRLSIGLETAEDLIRDLDEALGA